MKIPLKKLKNLVSLKQESSKQLALKLVEEFGEFTVSMFHEDGYKSTTKSFEEIKENQLEEGVDMIICILAAMEERRVLDPIKFKEMFKRKLKKWEKKPEKNNIIKSDLKNE